EDAWVRMRAIDALEKVCRVHPEWFDEYIDKLLSDFLSSGQPSIQWHLAEIFTEVTLSPHQYQQVEQWLVDRLVDENVDWIVAANSMKALVHFVESGHFSIEKMLPLLRKQLNHRSASVVKKAARYLERYAY